MPVSFFKTIANTTLVTSSFGPTKLIARSNKVGDTRMITAIGGGSLSSAVLQGRVEVELSHALTSVNGVSLSSEDLSANVSLLLPGSAAFANVFFTSAAPNGATLTVGLTGFARTYTFSQPALKRITCVAASALSQGAYINVIVNAGAAKRFWFDINNTGTGAPSDAGGGVVKVDVLSTDTDSDVAGKLAAAIDAESALVSSATGANVNVSLAASFGSLEVTDGDVATNFNFPTNFTGHSSGVASSITNQVAAGTTAAESAENLRRAIRRGDTTRNDAVGFNTLYTSTTPHPHLDADVNGATLTVTDLLACNRQLGWVLSTASSSGAIVTFAFSPGTDGTVIMSPTNSVSVYPFMELYNPTLLPNIPGRANITTDWLEADGDRGTLYLSAGATGGNLNIFYEISAFRNELPLLGSVNIPNLNNDSIAVPIPENAGSIRLNIENTGFTPVALHAGFCRR